MLKVTDLEITYGVMQAVHGVTFDVGEGEIVTLVGANGAGKTSTLKAIMGLVPSSGRVELQGHGEISGRSTDRIAGLGLRVVPEGGAVFNDMSVEDNLQVGYQGRDADARATLLATTYDRFPRLRERRRQTAGTLSGGERQMLAIGRALMGSPSVLLLDEPSFGLAPVLVREVFQLIAELNRGGITVLLVEQNARRALKIADRGIVLEKGSIVMSGTGEELSENEAVVNSYLGIRS